MSSKRIRTPLSDEDYLAAKSRAAINKANGDGFEVLIAMLFVMRTAIRAMRKSCRDARQSVIHLYNGEYVDDLKVSLNTRQTSRFIHAKSGPNVYWKRNLVRDFKSQSKRIPSEEDVRLELWLTCQDRKDALAKTIPSGMPAIKMVVWRDQWPLTEPWDVPRLARCLHTLVHQDSEMLRENAWFAIKNATLSSEEVSVGQVMKAAHISTCGAVASLDEPNEYLISLLPRLRQVKGLVFSVDGGTLLFWNSDVLGIYCQDIRRVSWNQVKVRLDAGRPLETLADFYLLLGGM